VVAESFGQFVDQGKPSYPFFLMKKYVSRSPCLGVVGLGLDLD
jgi:hypothetical protein